MPIFGARPAKGLTPIIGLAVVVALAMVAVFGAMSLTPSPAAAQATPNVSVEAYVGDTDPRDVNIIPYLNGRQGDFSGFGTVVVTPPDEGEAAHLMVVETDSFGIIGIRVTAAADANVGEYTITVPARFNAGRFIEVIVGVEILAATPATAVDEILNSVLRLSSTLLEAPCK